jgi:hypothetical protein
MRSRGVAFAAALTWFLIGRFILDPEWTMKVAGILCIGHGAELVL